MLVVVHNELSKLDFDVVALQETRLESGLSKFDNFALFNSGLESEKHEFGCGFYVSGEFLKYVKDFRIINERICCSRLKAKWFSCTLINVRAPTNEKTEEIKEEFYNLLEQNMRQIAGWDIKIILGDFNAKVGKVSVYKPTIGNESLRSETNNNGRKVIQFAICKGLNVRSTTFSHKDIHKETWYSADGRTANQIDHVLVSNRFRSAIRDRALRGPDIGSDRSVLKINFKVKLRVKTGNKYNEKRKMVNIFQNPKWKQKYAIEINNKFEILENSDDEDSIDNDINEKCENIKTKIKETIQQLIRKDEGTKTFKNKWYDEECKFAIEEMKKAREKWLMK
jgi:exonuclease III